MNNIHANIKFTVETEKDNHLPFLDVLITRTEDELINTTLHRKPTFTGLYMRYDSFVPHILNVVLEEVYSTEHGEFVHEVSSSRKKLDLSKIYCSVMVTLTML